jgi:hypothetical protein
MKRKEYNRKQIKKMCLMKIKGESKKIFRFVRLDKPNNMYYGKRRYVHFLLKGV